MTPCQARGGYRRVSQGGPARPAAGLAKESVDQRSLAFRSGGASLFVLELGQLLLVEDGPVRSGLDELGLPPVLGSQRSKRHLISTRHEARHDDYPPSASSVLANIIR
jgi:hypothetical protein